ncbi:hypothetical protein PAXRUDRAFT_825784 [Paxillus rubicundulus Ve08.2h10]|uniref:Unplaced genomic scaffold scaffold_156, whole genome shotgun sequence n=1 Tax=Paxillus rubicundulus Ve08.2h10 TaxID=930991 RepID=A0A0D0EAG7_9AGAM|nr:hypothetical protein PAXRUDRAFT_825784 [Paxillus rubicundulus Ve08.2h10]
MCVDYGQLLVTTNSLIEKLLPSNWQMSVTSCRLVMIALKEVAICLPVEHNQGHSSSNIGHDLDAQEGDGSTERSRLSRRGI